MDDTQKQLPNQQVSQQQPVQEPMSGGTREAPISVAQPKEWVSASNPEVVLPKEVQNAGVASIPVMPTIPQSAMQAGVTHAKEATPVMPIAAQPLGMATPRSMLENLKQMHKSVKDSISWLVRSIIKEQAKRERSPIT